MSNSGGNDSGARNGFDAALPRRAAESRTPDPFVKWLRTRTAGNRHWLSVRSVPTALTAASTANGTADPIAERACWEQLCAAVQVARNGDTTTAGTMLPAEIAAAEWEQNGQRFRVRQPGATTRALRCARRTISSLTPFPILGALSQPIAGGATAVGVLFAPIPMPCDPPPYSMPVLGRPLTGDVFRPAPVTVPGTHPVTPAIGPGAPLLPASAAPAPAISWPGTASERDAVATPTPSRQQTAPTAEPQAPVTAPPTTSRTAVPTPTPTPTSTPTPTPTPTTEVDAPSPIPPLTPTTTPTPPIAPPHASTQTHDRHKHGRHPHPLPRIHRRR